MLSQKVIKKDFNSKLRDKYLTETLKEETKIEEDHPILSELKGTSYLLKQIEEKIKNPLFLANLYDEINIKPQKSVIFYGIAGVGKTFLVKSISKELKIPLLRFSYFESEKEIKEMFRKAELIKPCILFLDDIDSLDIESDKNIIKQICESMDNLCDRVMVVGAARLKLSVNERLIEKFENEIYVQIPNMNDRKEILRWMNYKIKTGDLNYDAISRLTPGFVQKDLLNLIKVAANKAVERGCGIIEQNDYNLAIQEMKQTRNKDTCMVTFEDIGGLEVIKDELNMSLVLPFMFPEKFRRLGIKKPSGILLYGPPGCGKSMLAKAVSNMSHCNFISIKGPEIINKYVGESEKEIRKLFERAKQLQPCVLFFDEIDSLCSKRGKNEFGNRIVNQILTILDGLEDRGDVFIMGATNRIEVIDKAILRPGRFDKVIEVPLPSKKECVDIFYKCIRNVPVEELNIRNLELEGLSGAEISGLVKEAALLSLKENFQMDDLLISEKYFIEAIKKTKKL